jgi:hypothetical protein
MRTATTIADRNYWTPTQPYGYNPLRHVREDRIALAASGMMDVFKKMWPDAWACAEHILRSVLMAFLEQPDANLHEVLRIFSDKEFRRSVGKSLRNQTVRTFLLHEFGQFSFGYRADGTAPIQNKVGAFLADPLSPNDPGASERSDPLAATCGVELSPS